MAQASAGSSPVPGTHTFKDNENKHAGMLASGASWHNPVQVLPKESLPLLRSLSPLARDDSVLGGSTGAFKKTFDCGEVPLDDRRISMKSNSFKNRAAEGDLQALGATHLER